MAIPVHEAHEISIHSVENETDLSLVLTKPSGTVEDDLLWVAIEHITNTIPSITPPTGWTFEAQETSRSRQATSWYYKVAGPSEPSSYTFQFTGETDNVIGAISRISGVDTTNPVNQSSYGSNAVSPPRTLPSVTTTVDDCLIVRSFGCRQDGNTVSGPGTGETLQFNEWDSGPVSFTDCSNTLWTEGLASAGASGTFDVNHTDSTRDASWGTVALAPAAAGGVTGHGLSALGQGQVHGGGGFVNQGLHQITNGITA